MRSRPHTAISRHRAAAVALVCALVTATVACGGDDGGSATTGPATTPFDTLAPTVVPRSTSTDPAGTSSTSTTTTLAPTTTAAPTTTTPPPPVYPLTGLPLTDPVVGARPALIVKIDNSEPARPQTGFNAADLVVEEIINAGYTRFAFVFHSGNSDPVGPIRSGRLQDVDLFTAFNRPLFAWSGGNDTVTDAIRNSELVDVGPFFGAGNAYYRASDRGVPFNLYSTTDALWAHAPEGSKPPQQMFVYRGANDPVEGAKSGGTAMDLANISVEWHWDAKTGLYRRRQEGSQHSDRAGGQVTTNNVVVMGMTYVPGISNSPDAQTVGSGEVWVFSGGAVVHGRWSRDEVHKPFTLIADNGNQIKLTPGRTFLELPHADQPPLVLPPA